LHFALRVASPLHDVSTAEVAVGHYTGFIVGAPQRDRVYASEYWGGIFPGFNLSNIEIFKSSTSYANVPIDVRVDEMGRPRFMIYL